MTERDRVPKWWGKKDSTTTVVEMDVRPGGAWRYVSSAPDREDVDVLRRVPRSRPAQGLHVDVHVRRRGRRADGRPRDRTSSRTSGTAGRRSPRSGTWARADAIEGALATGMAEGAIETWDRLADAARRRLNHETATPGIHAGARLRRARFGLAPPAGHGTIWTVTDHVRDPNSAGSISSGCAGSATGSTASTPSPLDVEALARGAHMSAGHLSREFKLAYGEAPYGYLMTRRIERAMASLASRRPERDGGLLRSRLLVTGHVQHSLHGARRRAAQRLSARRDPGDRGDPAVRREAGDEADQESRSPGRRRLLEWPSSTPPQRPRSDHDCHDQRRRQDRAASRVRPGGSQGGVYRPSRDRAAGRRGRTTSATTPRASRSGSCRAADRRG